MSQPAMQSAMVQVSPEAWLSTVRSAWQSAGYRLTEPRLRVLQRIAQYTTPCSAEQLYADLQQEDGVVPGRATVYRTLDQLHSAGWLARIHAGGSETGYVASWPGHLHHLICTHCGMVLAFEGCVLNELLANLAQQTKFMIDGHLLQIYGRCANCAPSLS